MQHGFGSLRAMKITVESIYDFACQSLVPTSPFTMAMLLQKAANCAAVFPLSTKQKISECTSGHFHVPSSQSMNEKQPRHANDMKIAKSLLGSSSKPCRCYFVFHSPSPMPCLILRLPFFGENGEIFHFLHSFTVLFSPFFRN